MTETTTEITVVRAFLGALERLDVDAAVALLTDDVVYQNVPLPPARGRAAVEKQLRFLARWGRAFEVRWHNVASNGPIVLTERNDVLTFGPVAVDIWVCGTFEVREGRVVLWRDRFDFADLIVAVARGLVRAVAARIRN